MVVSEANSFDAACAEIRRLVELPGWTESADAGGVLIAAERASAAAAALHALLSSFRDRACEIFLAAAAGRDRSSFSAVTVRQRTSATDLIRDRPHCWRRRKIVRANTVAGSSFPQRCRLARRRRVTVA
jgi:hypothetical protein